MSISKELAHLLLPRPLFERVRSIRSRRFQIRLLEKQGILEANRTFLKKCGQTVKYGPFSGMTYPRQSAMVRISIPKLLGTYEQELTPIINQVANRKYDCVIDIGSAEGYYAVGLARCLKTKVLAYDPEPRERRFCKQMAEINGVGNLIEFHNLFLSADVSRFRDKRVLCICDCEGFEEQIFTAETVLETARWDLLIELHGDADRRLPALNWPQRTRVIEVPLQHREPMKELEGMRHQGLLLSEFRGPQSWLWCDSEQ
jgi:hypothetical protein